MPILEVYQLLDKKKINKQKYSLVKDIIPIGRAGNNDIVLAGNPEVSRYHAVLLRNPDDSEGYVIRDLSSSHGASVGKKFIFQKILKPGDIIRILNFNLEYATSMNSDVNETSNPVEGEYYPSVDIPEDQMTAFPAKKEISNIDIPGLSEEIRSQLIEFLYQDECTPHLLDEALSLLFIQLKMDQRQGIGGIALFEDEGKYIWKKQKKPEIKIIRPVSPSSIEGIKNGQNVLHENTKELFMPLAKKNEEPMGFLYLQKGPYEPYFQKNEIDFVSIICKELAKRMINKGMDVYGEEDFIEWPRTMIGNDEIYDEIKWLAQSDVDILILGETGVGKNVATKEIHRHSKKKDGPFKEINLADAAPGLIESELFGHVKGAFNNAICDKESPFELTDGGTIFLNEIGELPKELQAKLLRVIEDKIIKRVGGSKEKKIDVRVIAATNKNVEEEKEKGNLRADLFYRFGVTIKIKPLRERIQDVPLLAHYFLDKYASKNNLSKRGIMSQAMKCLLSYTWPGNVRELEKCIEKSLLLSKGVISTGHLPKEIREPKKPENAEKGEEGIKFSWKPRTLEETEKEEIMKVLEYTGGNREQAYKILGISRAALFNKLKKYGAAQVDNCKEIK